MSTEPRRHSPKASRDGAPKVHATARLRDAVLGRFTEIKERVAFSDSTLGDYAYVERDAIVIYARIGKFSCVAAAACINALEHPISRVSQHKITYRPNEYFLGAKIDKDFREKRRGRVVEIGHDVWVGHGAVIMPGVKIGDGAVVAAGAVVTRDVAPYAIVAGVPAKFLRWRFDPKIAERMIALAWWDWAHDQLADAVADMQTLSVEEFLEKYEK
jgi:phosphonate metabolism protein (transferase hexapeptide repeat family)